MQGNNKTMDNLKKEILIFLQEEHKKDLERIMHPPERKKAKKAYKELVNNFDDALSDIKSDLKSYLNDY